MKQLCTELDSAVSSIYLSLAAFNISKLSHLLAKVDKTLLACTVPEGLQGIIDFSLVVLQKRTSEKPNGAYIKDSHKLFFI